MDEICFYLAKFDTKKKNLHTQKQGNLNAPNISIKCPCERDKFMIQNEAFGMIFVE
jgi:hypothetical protein